MAHELDQTDGVTSFVSAHTMGWHQLGQLLDHSFTAEEAMTEGKLGGWDVRKIPAFGLYEGRRIAAPDRSMVIRNNPVKPGQIDYLGDVGVNYVPIQNEQHAALLNALVDESGAHFDTAGALEGGRRVFLTMKLPGHINVGGVDQVENYLAAINTHDGSMSFTLMVTPVRIVCKNTENMAFRNRSHIFRIRHSSGAEKLLHRQAREALDFTFDYLDGFQAEADELINTTLTQSQFEEIVQREFGAGEDASPAAVTRADKKVDKMVELFADAQTQSNIRDTAWAGLNALTEWNDHFSPTRGDDRENARAAKAIFDPTFKDHALRLMRAV